MTSNGVIGLSGKFVVTRELTGCQLEVLAGWGSS